MTEANNNNEITDNLNDVEEGLPMQSSPQKSRIRMAFTRWWIILIFAVMGYVVALYTLSIAEPRHSARLSIFSLLLFASVMEMGVCMEY